MIDQVEQNSTSQTDNMANINEHVEIVLDGVTSSADSTRMSEEVVYHMDTSEMAGSDGQNIHSIYNDEQT